MALSQVQLQGNLTREPELKYTGQGTAMLKFSLAVNTGFDDKQTASFYDCTIFGKQADALGKLNIQKGTSVIVAGEISIRKSQSDAGIKYTNVQVNVNSFSFAGKKGESSDSGFAGEAEDDAPPF